MKFTTRLAACLLGSVVLLGQARGDDTGTTIIYDGVAPGYDCPPEGHGHGFGHWHGHWDRQNMYPGVHRVAGRTAEAAGAIGYVGLQGGYHVGKTGWRMLEGDPGYQGHWNHPHHVAQYGYGGAGGGNWGPQHRTFYTYHHPTDLRYPSPNVPAAVVQYPYYTNRGPTDFFMK